MEGPWRPHHGQYRCPATITCPHCAQGDPMGFAQNEVEEEIRAGSAPSPRPGSREWPASSVFEHRRRHTRDQATSLQPGRPQTNPPPGRRWAPWLLRTQREHVCRWSALPTKNPVIPPIRMASATSEGANVLTKFSPQTLKDFTEFHREIPFLFIRRTGSTGQKKKQQTKAQRRHSPQGRQPRLVSAMAAGEGPRPQRMPIRETPRTSELAVSVSAVKQTTQTPAAHLFRVELVAHPRGERGQNFAVQLRVDLEAELLLKAANSCGSTRPDNPRYDAQCKQVLAEGLLLLNGSVTRKRLVDHGTDRLVTINVHLLLLASQLAKLRGLADPRRQRSRPVPPHNAGYLLERQLLLEAQYERLANEIGSNVCSDWASRCGPLGPRRLPRTAMERRRRGRSEFRRPAPGHRHRVRGLNTRRLAASCRWRDCGRWRTAMAQNGIARRSCAPTLQHPRQPRSSCTKVSDRIAPVEQKRSE